MVKKQSELFMSPLFWCLGLLIADDIFPPASLIRTAGVGMTLREREKLGVVVGDSSNLLGSKRNHEHRTRQGKERAGPHVTPGP